MTDKLIEETIHSGIESVKLNVEIQENGIIRNEKGRLIGRLVDDCPYDSEYVKHLTESSEKIEVKYKISDIGYNHKIGECPNCNGYSLYERDNYCAICGKKIVWIE